MSNNGAQITFTGNATADSQLKFLNDGTPVANFTVAVTPRVKDAQGNWGDGEAAFYRVAAWKKLGEGCAEAVKKGSRVTVIGTLRPREFEHNGEKRMSLDVTADDVSLSVLFMGGKANGGGGGGWGAPQGQPQQQSDPWAGGNAGGQQSGGWDAPGTDAEIPF